MPKQSRTKPSHPSRPILLSTSVLMSQSSSPSLSKREVTGHPPGHYYKIIKNHTNSDGTFKVMAPGREKDVIRRRLKRAIDRFNKFDNWSPLRDINEVILTGLRNINAINDAIYNEVMTMFNHTDYYNGERTTSNSNNASDEMDVEENSTISNNNNKAGCEDTAIGGNGKLAQILAMLQVLPLGIPSGGLKDDGRHNNLFPQDMNDLLFNQSYGLIANPQFKYTCSDPDNTVSVLANRALSLLNNIPQLDWSGIGDIGSKFTDNLNCVTEDELERITLFVQLEHHLAREENPIPDNTKATILQDVNKVKSLQLLSALSLAQKHQDIQKLPVIVSKYLRHQGFPGFQFQATCTICFSDHESHVHCLCSFFICKQCHFLMNPHRLKDWSVCKMCKQQIRGIATTWGLDETCEIAGGLMKYWSDQLSAYQSPRGKEGELKRCLNSRPGPFETTGSLNNRSPAILVHQLRIISCCGSAIELLADANRLIVKFMNIVDSLPETPCLAKLTNEVYKSKLTFDTELHKVMSSPCNDTTIFSRVASVAERGVVRSLGDFKRRHRYNEVHGVWMPRVEQDHVNRINEYYPTPDTRTLDVWQGTERRVLRRWFPVNPPGGQRAGNALANEGDGNQQDRLGP